MPTAKVQKSLKSKPRLALQRQPKPAAANGTGKNSAWVSDTKLRSKSDKLHIHQSLTTESGYATEGRVS